MSTSNMPSPDGSVMAITLTEVGATSGGYEKTDVSVSSILMLAFGFVFSVFVVFVVAWGVLHYFRQHPEVADTSISPLSQSQDLATKPRLQSEPLHDYQQFAATQVAILNRYEMQDRLKGIVRIPIARAMELIAARGNAATEPQLKKD